MNEKIKQLLLEEMLKLPKDLQTAINSFDWLKACEELGTKYSLTEQEINDFKAETGLVLVGLVDIDFYASTIEDNLLLTNEDSKNIAKDAEEKIFIPIANKREELIKNNIKNKELPWTDSMLFVLSGGDYSFLGDKPMAEAIRVGENKNIVI